MSIIMSGNELLALEFDMAIDRPVKRQMLGWVILGAGSRNLASTFLNMSAKREGERRDSSPSFIYQQSSSLVSPSPVFETRARSRVTDYFVLSRTRRRREEQEG